MTGNAAQSIDDLGLGVEYVPFRVLLDHPKTGLPLIDEKGVQAFVDVDGYNSAAGEKLKRAALQRTQRQKKGFRDTPADLDQMREENADALSQLTRGWHIVGLDGVHREFECNAANARALFSRDATAWIANQVSAALAVEANFIKA